MCRHESNINVNITVSTEEDFAKKSNFKVNHIKIICNEMCWLNKAASTVEPACSLCFIDI